MDGREAVRLLALWHLRLLAHAGGYAGGQAEYARVPFADVGPIKVPEDVSDEQALFLSDIFPTGYMGAEMCNIQGGDTIAVWGCGPVGQFAIKSAYLLGAERVIAIDRFEYGCGWRASAPAPRRSTTSKASRSAHGNDGGPRSRITASTPWGSRPTLPVCSARTIASRRR
jgi:hypothetical protein